MNIFQLSRRWSCAILDFWKVEFLTAGSYASTCLYASPCQISRRSVKPLLRYGDFSTCKMAAAVTLNFWNPEFLRVGRAKRVKLRQLAKFHGDRSKRCWDLAIYHFFNMDMAALFILDLFCAWLDHPRRVFGGLYRCATFGWNRRSSFNNMHELRFRPFGLKILVDAPTISVFGGFDPLNWEAHERNPKRHIRGRKYVIWRIGRQNRSTCATCDRDEETKKTNKETRCTVANWVFA